jgi:sortase A
VRRCLALAPLAAAAAVVPAAAAAPRAIGRIVIPRIGLDTPFFNGQSAAATDDGPAHYPWSGMPGRGRTVAIAGHRVTHTHPFLHLGDLRQNDVIRIHYGRAPRFPMLACYRISRSVVVPPTDVQVVRDLGFERLVLTTCTPPRFSTFRLVVVARRASCR